jgi:hypothetical protein
MDDIATDDRLLTPKDLAARLKVSVQTVYREQRDGRMPGRLVRGKLRFFWPEVIKSLQSAPAKHAMRYERPAWGQDIVAVLKARARQARRTE